jgi:acyl homoserine lactone synthase
MIQLITSDRYGEFVELLAEMHRLRFRVFKGRLDWDVETAGDMEVDDFDALQPAYLLLRASDGPVRGCVRLLPSTGPNMLRDTFPILLDGQAAPSSSDIWESSRFALEQAHVDHGAQNVARLTYELFAAMVEFGLARKLTSIVTVTDVRMERILRRAQWPLYRIGTAKPVGNTKAVAGHLEISKAALLRLRSGGDLHGPVLWMPVMNDAA